MIGFNCIFIFWFILWIETTSCRPLISDRDYDDTSTTSQPPQSLQHLSNSNLINTLRCALDMAVSAPKQSHRFGHRNPCRFKARELIRFLTNPEQCPTSSSSSQCSNASPVKKSRVQDNDPDYCKPSTSFGSGRRTPLTTMRKIVEMSESRSEASIKKLYRWYNRKYLNDFRRCVEAGGLHSYIRDQINNDVA